MARSVLTRTTFGRARRLYEEQNEEVDTISVDNSFDEFRWKGQLRIGSSSWRERWSQGRIFFLKIGIE